MPQEPWPETHSKAEPLSELLSHGQHVGARYKGGAWGASTDAERAAGGLSGTLKRFKKQERASDKAQAFGWIKATYAEAIEYSGMRGPLEGGIMIGAFFGLLISGGGIGFAVFLLSVPDWFAWVLGVPLLAAGISLLSWFILKPLRHVWRAPRDLPILFDRAHRRVYRILRDVQPGFAGLFKPWPIKAVSYEWDLLDAEHDGQVMASTATVSRLNRLVFVVRKSAQDPTIIDHFEIGNGMAQGEEMIAPMWEHIRRFMEQSGPHLPSAGEVLDGRVDEQPTWWQACGEAGPFGSRYGWWWEHHPILTGFYHFIILAGMGLSSFFFSLNGHVGSFVGGALSAWIVLSINWGHGTGRWLVAHTSRLYDWPQAVKDAVGVPTRIGVGWQRG